MIRVVWQQCRRRPFNPTNKPPTSDEAVQGRVKDQTLHNSAAELYKYKHKTLEPDHPDPLQKADLMSVPCLHPTRLGQRSTRMQQTLGGKYANPSLTSSSKRAPERGNSQSRHATWTVGRTRSAHPRVVEVHHVLLCTKRGDRTDVSRRVVCHLAGAFVHHLGLLRRALQNVDLRRTEKLG